MDLTHHHHHHRLASINWFQDLPRIGTLALVYTLAGADCIDLSASEAVVTAAAEVGVYVCHLSINVDFSLNNRPTHIHLPPQGVEWAMQLAAGLGRPLPRRPWLMVSVNDQEDLHFRKASFDATHCPADCPRPCEIICPTRAIPPAAALGGLRNKDEEEVSGRVEGVAEQGRCYGCGRCLAVCPLGLIEARPYEVDAAAVLSSLAGRVDALEIHTNASSFSHRDRPEDDPFHGLCARLRGPPSDALKLVAVSFPFLGEDETTAFLRHRRQLLSGLGAPVGPPGRAARLRVWQTDGRPMSGDIGKGATLSCVRFGAEVLRAQALPFFRLRGGAGAEAEAEEHHFLQLAGGTNAYTAEKLEAEGLLSPWGLEQQGGGAAAASWVHGLAFGGFARKEVDRVMENHRLGLEDNIRDYPEVCYVVGVKIVIKLTPALISFLTLTHRPWQTWSRRL